MNNIFKNMAVLLAVLVLTSAFSGCVKLERPALDRKYFTLDVTRGGEESPFKISRNLIVRRVKISPRYEDRDLVYRTGFNSFESDYYNSFFIPPAAMLTQELRVWMAETGIFANVLGPESLGTGEFLLEGMVNSLYGDYSGAEHKAVLEMQFFLLNNSDPDLPIIYSRTFNREIPINGAGPDVMVRALNKGVKDTFAELESDLVQVLSESSGE